MIGKNEILILNKMIFNFYAGNFQKFNFLNWLLDWIFGNRSKNELTGNFVATKYINNSRWF
jgi:hypothetical protein